MNLFLLSRSARKAAIYQCDKHVVKMILETAQMLSTAIRLLLECHFNSNANPTTVLYKSTHRNHPMSIWVRQSLANFKWALCHGRELCAEYTRRYEKQHKSVAVYDEIEQRWLPLLTEKFTHDNNNNCNITIPPMCMPDIYKANNNDLDMSQVVQAYRRYYRGDKVKFAKWGGKTKCRTPPIWWNL